MHTADQDGKELVAIVARQDVTGRQAATQSNSITADIPLDRADRDGSELAAIVTRSGAAAAATASVTDTNADGDSGERGNKRGNKRGLRDGAGRCDSSTTGSACHSDTVTRMDTPNNPAGDDLSGDNLNNVQHSNDMIERRDAETDLHRIFNELTNIHICQTSIMTTANRPTHWVTLISSSYRSVKTKPWSTCGREQGQGAQN